LSARDRWALASLFSLLNFQMCCFSRPVTSVSRTRIFARFIGRETQSLAYEMALDTPEDVAMILPLPASQDGRADALAFINLEGYPTLFRDLERAFPPPPMARSFGAVAAPAAQSGTLVVERVGSFEASYVPTIADFARLDARFRLPEGTWDKLPQYRDYAFAVFKLRRGISTVHPMALSFRSALPSTLFFPTVHIHDGQVHARERFDHVLYAQAWANATLPVNSWQESPGLARATVEVEKAQGLVWPDGHLYRRQIDGPQKNQDTLAQARRL